MIGYKEEKKNKWMELELAKSKLTTTDNDDDDDDKYYNYQLNGLQRGTVYQLYLRSIGQDKNSISEPSDMLTIRTGGEGNYFFFCCEYSRKLNLFFSSKNDDYLVPLVNMLNSNQIESQPQQPYHAVAAIPTAAFMPTLATYNHQQQQQVPPYFRIGFIIPIAIAIVVIVIACVGAYVYIRIDDRNQQMKLYNAAASVSAPGNGCSNVHVGTLAVGPGKRFQYISPGHTSSSGVGKMFNTSITPSSLNSSGIGLRDNSCTQSLVSEESSLSFRYSDSSSDKGRLLLSRPPPQQSSSSSSMIPTGVVWAQQQSPIPEEDEAIVDIDSSAYETLPFQKNGQFQSTPMQSFTSAANQSQHQLTNSSNNSTKSPSFPPPPPPLPGAIFKSSPLNNAKPNTSQNNNNNNNIFCHHVDVHHTQSSAATSDTNNSDSYDDFRFFSRV